MSSNRAVSSKKHRNKSKSKSSCDISEKISEINLEYEASGETSKENGACAENGSIMNEDELITNLYQEVIDEIMSLNKEKFIVSDLSAEMKTLMRKAGSNSKVKGDRKINLSKASNLCVYLSIHGTCHTGLVKKAIGAYFQFKKVSLISNRLRVVSLGGGPGYDLVGFCSALQQAVTLIINKIRCKIVDTLDWKPVFKSILKTSKESDYGILSNLHKEAEISGGFIEADLKTDDVFKDPSFSSAIQEADFVLMVKLESFLTNYGDENFIKNVVDTMKVGAKFIFIFKEDFDLFDNIVNCYKIYEHFHNYRISFNPVKYGKFFTSSDGARICVYQKVKIDEA